MAPTTRTRTDDESLTTESPRLEPRPQVAPPHRDLRTETTTGQAWGWAVWAAVALALLVAGALLVAAVTGRTADEAAARRDVAAGSDRHLGTQAREAGVRSSLAGSDRHLHTLADELAARHETVHGNDRHLHNLAGGHVDQPPTVHGNDRHLHNLAGHDGRS